MKTKDKLLIESLLTDNSHWNFWEKNWTKVVFIKWNGETPFKEVRKIAAKHMGIKECEMIYERSLSLMIGKTKPDLLIN